MLNNLPPELLIQIFQYLPIKNRLHLKTVSKKFNHLLSLLKPESLTILAENEFELNYFFSTKPIKSNEVVVNRNEDLLLSAKLNSIFINLKKLTTYFYSDTLIQLSHFYNQFDKLEKLTIYHRCRVENKIVLNLDHLRTLKIILDFGSDFELNTPRLTKLECEDLDNFKFNYPNTIKILKVEFFDNSFNINFEKFTNLELLVISSEEWTLITNNLIRKLPSLKELHFASHTYVNNEVLDLSFDHRLFKNLKLFQFGFNVSSDVEITNENFPDCKSSEVTKFLIKNFEKTANKVHFRFEKLDYNEIINNGKHLIEKKFYEKFSGFLNLKISGQVEDENQLLDFLKKVKPEGLKFKDALLSRSFFDQLSYQCSFIRELKFKGSNGKILDFSKDFQFVYRLENLSTILFLGKIHLNYVIELYEKCENLSEVSFIIDKMNQINFCLSYVNSLSEFIIDDEHNHIFTCLEGSNYFETKKDMLIYLKEKRVQFKSDPIDLRELIFSIDADRYRIRLIESIMDELLKTEIIYLDKSVLDFLKEKMCKELC